MFQVEEVNCICVDWKRGSQTTYTQAANNVRVVGAQVAQMIDILVVSGSDMGVEHKGEFRSYERSRHHLSGT